MIEQTKDTAQYVCDELEKIKKKTETKLAILNTCYAVANRTLNALENEIQTKTRAEDTIVFALDKDKIAGNRVVDSQGYTQYGQTAHASFISLPAQVCNILTDTGPIFKDNASVSFITEQSGEEVDDYSYSYANILRHEADPDKEDVFHTFPVSHVTLRVEIKPSLLIGNSSCNLIELCPYLPGTFAISEIRVWTMDQYLSNDLEAPAFTTPGSVSYQNMGAARIYIDPVGHTTFSLYRIEFDLVIQQQENGYSFGLKHLYFYNANMDTANSYVIVKIEKDGYVSSVGQTITAVSPEGPTTVQPESYYPDDDPENYIRFYMFYENGSLQNEISRSAAIARNITSFYAKVPLFRPIKAISFNGVKTR